VQVAVLLLVALAGWVHSHKHKKVRPPRMFGDTFCSTRPTLLAC